MKSLFLAASLLLSTACLVSVQAVADYASEPSDSEQASKALQQQLADMTRFYARFEQQVFDMQQQLVQQGEGELWLQQPGKFRYQMELPEPILFVGDGETLWYYHELLEQVTIYDAKAELERTPFTLLMSNDASLWQQYRISQLDDGYRIQSVDPASPVQYLQLHFTAAGLNIMQVLDLNGQRSIFHFQPQPDVGSDFATDLFQFQPPADVDIDDQR
ncbi:outer membrane lipoprotein chaperone LolA [Alkalimonas amylolytica]|uniref:Outer-membrane lipoprotein carrier protein n=1 Tax=Alkalimonas amylolytica TaxID=152573 RepID=A0A1H3ZT49_ALKAM|nr:outer membrane lipoprotein chaperone LolA [Alkalimonas amylolytica]SEA26785.1 outer membrane lipoprotein carrier protein [Alkalimonas amylolytica]